MSLARFPSGDIRCAKAADVTADNESPAFVLESLNV
jgi:hypothetical protein